MMHACGTVKLLVVVNLICLFNLSVKVPQTYMLQFAFVLHGSSLFVVIYGLKFIV